MNRLKPKKGIDQTTTIKECTYLRNANEEWAIRLLLSLSTN